MPCAPSTLPMLGCCGGGIECGSYSITASRQGFQSINGGHVEFYDRAQFKMWRTDGPSPGVETTFDHYSLGLELGWGQSVSGPTIPDTGLFRYRQVAYPGDPPFSATFRSGSATGNGGNWRWITTRSGLRLPPYDLYDIDGMLNGGLYSSTSNRYMDWRLVEGSSLQLNGVLSFDINPYAWRRVFTDSRNFGSNIYLLNKLMFLICTSGATRREANGYFCKQGYTRMDNVSVDTYVSDISSGPVEVFPPGLRNPPQPGDESLAWIYPNCGRPDIPAPCPGLP